MEEGDRQLLLELKARLPRDVADRVKRLIVFGSRAHGHGTGDSDLDVVALVDEKSGEIEARLDDIVYDLMWEHDFEPIVSLKVFDEAQFQDALNRGFSFYKRVAAEGIPL